MGRSGGGLKLYALIISVFFLLAVAAFSVLFIHGGYYEKVMYRLGLKEREVPVDWTAVSWESCLRGLEIDSDVVFFGDSITRGGEFYRYFPDLEIVNLGLSGDNLEGMVRRIGMIEAVSPEKIFIMAGINGLTDNNHDEMLSAYEGLLDGIRDVVPGIEIYIESVLPLSPERCGRVTNDGIISFNSRLERLAESEGCTYVDIHRHYYRGSC